MQNFQPSELLEAIHNANCFFHLNFEKDQKEKSKFYKVKDTIVAETIKGRYPGITCIANEIQHDGTHVYVFFTFTAGNTSIAVHFPANMIPADAKYESHVEYDTDGVPVTTAYQKKLSKYEDTEVSEEEYARCRNFLDSLYSELFAERVDAMNDEKLMGAIKSTSCKMGMKPSITSDGNFLFSTRKKNRPIYNCRIIDVRNAVKAVWTFNYCQVYKQLKSWNAVNMLGALPHPDWKW